MSTTLSRNQLPTCGLPNRSCNEALTSNPIGTETFKNAFKNTFFNKHFHPKTCSFKTVISKREQFLPRQFHTCTVSSKFSSFFFSFFFLRQTQMKENSTWIESICVDLSTQVMQCASQSTSWLRGESLPAVATKVSLENLPRTSHARTTNRTSMRWHRCLAPSMSKHLA